MKTKFTSFALAALLLASAGAANASEPLMLSDGQMDTVAAGFSFGFGIGDHVFASGFNPTGTFAFARATSSGPGSTFAFASAIVVTP